MARKFGTLSSEDRKALVKLATDPVIKETAGTVAKNIPRFLTYNTAGSGPDKTNTDNVVPIEDGYISDTLGNQKVTQSTKINSLNFDNIKNIHQDSTSLNKHMKDLVSTISGSSDGMYYPSSKNGYSLVYNPYTKKLYAISKMYAGAPKDGEYIWIGNDKETGRPIYFHPNEGAKK